MLSLTYVSSAAEELGADQLSRMLSEIRPKNEALGITGMLLHSGGNIIQVLEGPADAVEATFRTIESDPRHHGIIVLLREEVEARAFPDWSMGFRRIGRGQLAALPGYNDFLAGPLGSELGLEAGSAYRLLELFRDGMR